jgi:hypothetical protein
MPGANPNLGSFPGRITNAQQAQADARVAANTAASKNKVAPNESAAETNRLKNSKPIVASPNIVRKTTQGTITQELKQVTVSRQKVVSAKAGAVLNKPRVGENVLNAYRSFNYNFTLSAL